MKKTVLNIFIFFSIPSFCFSFMGINTNEVLNYNAVAPFIDLFRSAEPLKGQGVTFDSYGWPTNLNGSQASTHFLKWFNADAIPSGLYIVRYEGEGSLTYSGGVELISSSPGRDLITLIPNTKFNEITAKLSITKLNIKNPIKNIQITPSGGICKNNPFLTVPTIESCKQSSFLSFEDHAKKIIFNPDYLNFMKDFKSIRFMNMSGIVRNPIRDWKDRPKINDATWGGAEGQRGAPLEIMIKLANLINADAWFNIPFAATDNYIRKHAQTVKSLLNKNLKVYIEYTNEAWNGIFHNQMKYLQEKGKALRLDENSNKAAQKFYSKRSIKVFKIWGSILPKSRLVRVLSGFTPALSLSQSILNYNYAYKHTDAFAIAPYFYANEDLLLKIKSVDDIFSLINSTTQLKSLPNLIIQIEKQNELLKSMFPKIKLVAYEGGQHFVSYKSKSKKDFPNPEIFKANKDPRMYSSYIKLINSFKQNGVLFIAFRAPEANAKFGAWGVKEHLRQPNYLAPKYQALTRFFELPKPEF